MNLSVSFTLGSSVRELCHHWVCFNIKIVDYKMSYQKAKTFIEYIFIQKLKELMDSISL